MTNISTTETLKMEQNFPGSRHKFRGKRETSKPQSFREVFRPDFPAGNAVWKRKNSLHLIWRSTLAVKHSRLLVKSSVHTVAVYSSQLCYSCLC